MVFVLSALINMRHLLAAMLKMSNIVVSLIFAMALGSSIQVWAQQALTPLNQSQIRSDMFGQMFTGEYSNGARWAERFNPNMTSVYVEDGISVHGHMEFKGSILCFDYPYRTDLTGGCFEIWKRGSNCFDFYGPQSNVSFEDRRLGRNWMARAWISDVPSTCKGDLISRLDVQPRAPKIALPTRTLVDPNSMAV